MSYVKNFTKYNEYNATLISILKYLVDKDTLPRDETRGIAKQIIKGLNPKDLNTSSQRWSFYNRLEPHLIGIRCENEDCNVCIGIGNLEEGFKNEEQYGTLLCLDCLINKWRGEHYCVD